MDSDKEVIEIAFHRRRLELLKNAVVDTQELYARCKVTMQYLDDARKDYESRPRAGHIYESVMTFTKWFDKNCWPLLYGHI